MIYVGKQKLLDLVKQNESGTVTMTMLDYFCERNNVTTRKVSGVECIVDGDILTVLCAMTEPAKAFGILVDILHHNDTKVLDLEQKCAQYERQLAQIRSSLDALVEQTKPQPTGVVKVMPAPKPVVSEIGKNVNGTRAGKTPACIRIDELSITEKATYNNLLQNVRSLFGTQSGTPTGYQIYALMGKELVSELGKRYAHERGKASSRVTTLCAPMLAAVYSTEPAVRESLKGVI